MIDEAILKSNFAGKDGFTWWIGQVADPKVWLNQKVNAIDKDLKAESWGYRCKVRIIGFHTFDRSQLADNDLPWAHILSSAADGAVGQGGFGKTAGIIGGETVVGFFLDGEEAQQPVVFGCINRSPAVINVQDPDPFEPFTGFKGKFVSENLATRVPGQKGVIAPKEKTLGSGSQFKVKGDNTAYENLGSTTAAEQQDPGITGETKTESKPDAGAKYESPKLIINFDSLIDLDQAELGFLRTASAPFPETGANGCQDNILANIHAAINSFMKFVNSLESTALGFIDPVRNLVVDMGATVSRIARKVAGMMKMIMNAMRDDMFKLIGKLFKVLGIAIPSPISLPISEATKVILDIIFCIFEKLFGPITDFISSLIDGMLGKLNHFPTCAAQEFVASLLSKLEEMLNSALAPVLSGLDWLAGGIGQISGMISGAVAQLQQLLSFLDCDSLKCEGSIDFDPFGGIKLPSPDNWQQTLQNLDILNDLKTAESGIDEAVGYMSIFGSSDSPFGPCREEIINPTDQNSVASLPIGLKYDTCLPPTAVVVGDGKGAVMKPVVASDGTILTVAVQNPGKGFTKAPNVYVVDNTGCGKGAIVKTTITPPGPGGSGGSIDGVIVVDPGEGYIPGELEDIADGTIPCSDDSNCPEGYKCVDGKCVLICTEDGDCPEGYACVDGECVKICDEDGDCPLGFTCINGYCVPISGISSDPVGIITSIIIDGPGIGYTSGDDVSFGGCVYKPILTDNGSIVGFESDDTCKDQFDFYPGAAINTKTGYGAKLFPVMKFVPQYLTVDNAVASVGIGTTLINVIDCV